MDVPTISHSIPMVKPHGFSCVFRIGLPTDSFGSLFFTDHEIGLWRCSVKLERKGCSSATSYGAPSVVDGWYHDTTGYTPERSKEPRF